MTRTKEKDKAASLKKLKQFTENLVFVATDKGLKKEIIYIRVNENMVKDLEDMQEYFSITKRTDLVRTIIEDAIKNFRKVESGKKE